MRWFTRMFTLPKRYNSLADIARNPLGAVLNTAQWAVPLAMGLPKGFQSLPQLLRNPSLIAKWSLGNAPQFFGIKGAITTQSAMNWFKKPENLALVAGGLAYLDQSRRARNASAQLDAYRQQLSGLGELERLFNTQLLNRRLDAVGTVLNPAYAIAQLRAVETDTANRARRMMDTAGVKSQRSVENALVRTAGELARQRALIPLQYAQATLGIPLGMQYTSLVGSLLGQQRADELLALQQLIPALLQLYAYTRGITPTPQQTTIGG
jgi:hypothetical protein